jgi:glycosyltransferase involved in cell wall biosynthesis
LFTEQHGWPEQGIDFHQVGTFMEGFSIRHADALMACSANIADLAARVYGVPRDGIDVIHCGVDADVFRPLNREARAADKPTVLFVGNWMEDKGLTATLEAVTRLRPKYSGLALQVAGKSDRDSERSIKSLVHKFQADGYIEFLGFVGREDIPQYYRQAQVFCAPSHHEPGVANVYLEAMACACPVVAATTGAAREAVMDGETGFLVPPHDVKATAAALDRLLSDPSLRAHMGAAARRRVEEWFSMDKYIGRVLANYRKAMHRSVDTQSKQLAVV